MPSFHFRATALTLPVGFAEQGQCLHSPLPPSVINEAKQKSVTANPVCCAGKCCLQIFVQPKLSVRVVTPMSLQTAAWQKAQGARWGASCTFHEFTEEFEGFVLFCFFNLSKHLNSY